MVVMSRADKLTVRDLPANLRETVRGPNGPAGASELSIEGAEKQLIIRALKAHDGNRTKAAKNSASAAAPCTAS